MIIIIGSNQETHSKYIYNLLKSKGVNAAYLDTRNIPNDFISSWHTTEDMVTGTIRLDNKNIDLQDIKSVYWRWHYGINILPKSSSEQDRFLAGMIKREFNCYIDSLFESLDCLWVNSARAINMHKTKAYQLHIMAKNGIRVPKTLITNDKDELKSFIETYNGELIFKPVRGGAHTEKFDEKCFSRDRLEHLKYSPVTFQEKAEGVDLRVYGIGNKLFSAEIRTKEVDFRNDPKAELVPIEIPDVIRNDCLKIMKLFGLNFTAIDIKYNPETGEYIFIEANPSPMFIHFEKKTEYPISDCLTEMLIKGK